MFGDYQLKGNVRKSVSIVMHLPSRQNYAMKRIPVDCSNDLLKLISEEVLLVLSLKSMNICEITSVFVTNCDINIVSPLYCFGSANDCMKNHFVTGFPEIIASLILRDVLNAIQYLVNRGIVHRWVCLRWFDSS
jgi:serine/threonine protein kinase